MLKIVTIFVVLVAATLAVHDKFRVQFQWKYINVTWPSEEARQTALENEEYIPENNAIAGIKLWKHRMYLTVPRWKNGVPVTLGVTSSTPQNNITAPNLEPYPNWEMQKVGNCKAFQFVQSMEIDPKGRMWVLDTGRTATMTLEAKARCTPRLVILDLEDNGKVLRSYEFPEDVTPKESAYLNDIVLDHREGGIAYITDNGKEDPGIIVYSLQNNTSWKFRHPSTKAESDAVGFMVANTRVTESVNVDGIALSPASASERFVYYTPLSSFHFYSIPTSVLINRTENAGDYVRELGRRTSQTDGIAMSATGVLYYGLIADDAIASWDTKESNALMQRVISRDHELTQWPDTFAFDEDGYLWCVINALQNFINNKVNISVPNYRIIKSQDGGIKNYQYFSNGSAPELPHIAAGASRITVGFASCLVILLVSILQ